LSKQQQQTSLATARGP